LEDDPMAVKAWRLMAADYRHSIATPLEARILRSLADFGDEVMNGAGQVARRLGPLMDAELILS